MGRPFLYSLTYGEEGVVHAIESKSQSLSFISSLRSLPMPEQCFVGCEVGHRVVHVTCVRTDI